MASGIVKGIFEEFCQCSICLEQFKEPKLLPCLHRFCKDCLTEVIQQNRGSVSCPVCREECIIPKEGLDGFKTDFYTKNIIEYIQLQTTLHDKHTQECYGCSKALRVSAYCFKCNDFLCESCHQFHVTSKITKDHRQHTLAIEDVASKRLTLDKLASLKEAPRCSTHSEKLSELCCKTCSNTPICIACTYGNHEGHDFREVTALANDERRKLGDELAELLPYGDKILIMPQKLKKLQEEIETIVLEKKSLVQSDHTDKKEKIEEKIQTVETTYKLSKTKKEEELNKELSSLQKEMERELQEIREKYEKLFDEKKQQVSRTLQFTKEQHDEQVLKLRGKLSVLNMSYEEAVEFLLTQQEGNIQKAQVIAKQFESMIKRFENLKATTTTLLESMNDWTVLQCIPDILAAKKPLVKEMKKEIPELKTLTEIKTKLLPSIFVNDRVCISLEAESVWNFKGTSRWRICNITTTQNEHIVLTGNATDTLSHITVLDIKGEVLFRELRKTTDYRNPDCMCDFLSESKIVTACDPRDLGIYDIDSKQNVIQRDVRSVTDEWPPERGVTCVVSDITNNQIILGNFKCRHLYFFDMQFNFRRKLVLPGEGCHGLTVCGSNLAVCDWQGCTAFTMNMQGEVVHEFRKPYDAWKPASVCKDDKGNIYVLWTTTAFTGRVISQHNQDNGHLLEEKTLPMDNDGRCLTTMIIDGKEKLLVAGRSNGKLFMYGLVSPLARSHKSKLSEIYQKNAEA